MSERKTQLEASPRPAPTIGKEALGGVARTMQGIHREVSGAIVGKQRVMELVAAAMVTEGCHILFEDMPGLAKSVMASSFAHASGCEFHRVQFTPDLLPGDITGSTIYNARDGSMSFRRGPIFSNILLADEINRASPKTQSALLEAMAEKQVSVDGMTYALPKPFMVLATQNPIEQEGTYPLPEAQLDRFMLKLSMGYPSLLEEIEILRRRNTRGMDGFRIKPVASPEQLHNLARTVESVYVSDAILEYVGAIVDKTRSHEALEAGASPRGSLALLKLSKSWAATHGRHYVVPEDVRLLADPVLSHRLVLSTAAKVAGTTANNVVEEVVESLPVPKLTVAR